MEDMVTATLTVDATLWIRAAQAAVRRYCGWHVAPSAEVSGALGMTGARIVQLPARHITEVKSLAWSWRCGEPDAVVDTERGLVEFRGPVPSGIAALEYDIVCGWDPEDVPDVRTVIMQAARRAQAGGSGMVRAQTVNGASVTYATDTGGLPAVRLLKSEMAILDPYRVTGGVM